MLLRGGREGSHSWEVRAHSEVSLRLSGGALNATTLYLVGKVTMALNSEDHRGWQEFSEDQIF